MEVSACTARHASAHPFRGCDVALAARQARARPQLAVLAGVALLAGGLARGRRRLARHAGRTRRLRRRGLKLAQAARLTRQSTCGGVLARGAGGTDRPRFALHLSPGGAVIASCGACGSHELPQGALGAHAGARMAGVVARGAGRAHPLRGLAVGVTAGSTGRALCGAGARSDSAHRACGACTFSARHAAFIAHGASNA